MEQHKTILKSLCRLCCEKIDLTKRGYVTAKPTLTYVDVLGIFYGFYVNTDIQKDTSIYPQTLCLRCHQKLKRLGEKDLEHPGTYLESYQFLPHDDNCELCHKYGVKPDSEIKVRIDEVDQAMKNAGFVKLPNPPVPYRRVYLKPSFSNNKKLANEILVQVNDNNSVNILVFGKQVPTSVMSKIPTIDKTAEFAQFFSTFHVCTGIPGFKDVIDSRLEIRHPFLNMDGDLNAGVESLEHIELPKADDMSIIRHKSCSLFVYNSYDEIPINPEDEGICLSCRSFRNTQLLKIRTRQIDGEPEAKKRRSDSSRANLRYLGREAVEERYNNAQSAKWALMRKVSKLNFLIQEDVKVNAVTVEDEEHEILQSVIKKNSIDYEFDEDTPQWLLWQQQKLQASKKNSKGMRWHPLIIRWCLSIYRTSPAAYRQISSKTLNFLQLPHVTTLKKYINFTDISIGFNPDIIKKLAMEADIKNMPEKNKHVVIAFDEMKIKSGLVYHRGSGKLIGFTELGSLNDEFAHFEQSSSSVDQDHFDLNRDIATHVNLYMVRGICSSLLFPFGYFATAGMTPSELYLTTKEAVRVLSTINFKVRALVSDGAATNRKMYRIMAKDNSKNFHWENNSHGNLPIYFFSDTPHLLKTTRNCFENSKANRNTRNLHLDGQDISWQHIVRVVEEDMGIITTNEGLVSSKTNIAGLRKLQLTDDHIHLTPRSRMTVLLAAQVLSQTTANALIIQGKHDTKSTIAFVQMIDRVFDCLNVSKLNQDRKGKKELAKYEAANDWRFHFLEVEFLDDYLGRWQKQVEAKTFLEKAEKQKQLLSPQTRLGWRMTVLSFVRLVSELLKKKDELGLQFILSEKFSQDPVEEHFGRQRRQGGTNENPKVIDFVRQEVALGAMKTELMQDLKGNCLGADTETKKVDINDTRRMPTKRTIHDILKYD